ncbi:MAG TPA: hypothetical protein VGN36_04100, partial [Sphingorhabdus sp.]|nr:hypothetical protein [Sphingorhabdus sp.]
MSAVFVLVLLAAIVGIFKPYIPNAKRWHFGLAAFAAFIMIGVTAPDVETESKPSKRADAAAATSNDEKPEATAPKSKWTYETQKDEMRGEETRYATLDAENTLSLDFPYGEQRGQILIRKSPKFGFDLLVGVPSGQILCSSFQDSYISAKFDDGGIERFGCTDASDGTNNMVFLINDRRFLEKL